MVIEVAIICVTLIILAAMGFVYLERSKPKPVQVIPELEKIKDTLKVLESRVNAINIGRMR